MTRVQDVYGDFFNATKPQEAERLRALSLSHDDATHRYLQALALNSSPRCLDLGPGAGLIPLWLAEHTGLNASEVVALDKDTALPQQVLGGRDNIRIVEADINDPNVDCGTFDLIHARFVLIHLREREEILKKLVSWLRPGGWLVITDVLWKDTGLPDTSFNRLMNRMWSMLDVQIGSDAEWASRIEPLMLAEGASSRMTICDTFRNNPHVIDHLETLWRLSFIRMKDELLADGSITEAMFDDAIASIRTHFLEQDQPQIITCCGRFD